ncbi:MAG: RluA family pseudouridine synthase [Rickettsia endosymbiont of Sergentomyia squamirostris]|uniref:Ribosomal large subunit pseudouridine synthase C n=1 Tax=Candidatus Tisiphia endosymbiont of Sergentomyia squamirostris TaxID=3113639 RepID=A0AAT9G7U3_9RICK
MAILNVDIELPCRLDRYLKKLYPSLTQGMVERALRFKQIMVNSCKVAANLRIKAGDQIFIEDSLNLEPQKVSDRVFSSSTVILAGKLMKDYLVYQDEWLIAINKPVGLATQGGSKISLSIDDALQYLNSQGADLKLVHRLDKDTSGILLIAKNYASSIKLVKAFKEKNIQKTYIAVVLGNLPQHEGEISGMIGKNRGGAYETVQNDEEHGKLAITCYKLLKNLNNGLTLVEFTPLTGRMHQLRFHAKMLGCPLIGDTKYGTQEAMALSKEMLLHAKRIILPEKIFAKEIIINIDLPGYFYPHLFISA